MKKKFLFLMALLAVSLLALAEMSIFVYQKDGEKVEYLAANVDSIGFANVFTITFDANGGDGSMDVVKVKEGETITLSDNTFTKGTSTFVGWNTQADGTGTAYADKASVSIVASQTLYAQWEAPNYEWVDLGLPSGTKWATMNVGADSPEDYGDYFAWGETTTKSSYTYSNYTYSNNPTILPLGNDAANVNWGDDWRMPTKAEQDELRNTNYTTWTWTTQNGVSGYKVTSKVNGNSIFLPAAGIRDDSDLISAGSSGYYWSSSLITDDSRIAYYLDFDSYGVYSGDLYGRYFGGSVRPVIPKFYSITFDSNEGAGSMDVFKIKSLGSDVLPKNEFIRDGYFFYGWNTKADGTGTHYVGNETISLEADMTLYAQWAKICEATTTSGHEWVDLGLPSGTRWATCNIGASQPEIVGSYFRWSYQAYGGTSSNPQTASLSSDLAYKNWGSDWRMPTIAEQDELANDLYTDWYAYTLNGVDGYLIISKINGNNIFLPIPVDDSCGYACMCGYWNSSVYKQESSDWYQYYYISYMVGKGTAYRDISYDAKCTRQVRPVLNYTITITFDANGASGTMDDFFIAQSTSKKLPKNEYYRDGYGFIGWNTAADGTGTAYTEQSTITPSANMTLYAQWENLTSRYVDLGLPSGTKWATMNVGANSPEDYGDYFAWGETTPKSSYTSSNNSYSSNPTMLPLDRDAAYTNWGLSWRMPTSTELEELIANCTWIWTTQNGVSGYIVTGPNGYSIFLPASGYRNDSSLNDAGSTGRYWSSSLYTDNSYNAYVLYFNSDYIDMKVHTRNYGLSVRAVLRE